jgi:hypothetical protein
MFHPFRPTQPLPIRDIFSLDALRALGVTHLPISMLQACGRMVLLFILFFVFALAERKNEKY